MLSFINHGHKDYDTLFRSLLSLHAEFRIAALVEDSLPARAASSSSSYFSLFQRGAQQDDTAVSKQIGKALRHKVESWSETMDEALESARYCQEDLDRLKKTVSKIFYDQKLTLLKFKLQEEGCWTPKLQKATGRLEQLVLRVLSTPPLSRLRPPGASKAFVARCGVFPVYGAPFLPFFPLYRRLPPQPLPPIQEPVKRKLRRVSSDGCLWRKSAESPGRLKAFPEPLSEAKIQKGVADKMCSLDKELTAMHISSHTPRMDKDWERKLLNEVKRTESKEVVIELSRHLEPIQFICLINHLIHDQCHEWKLIYLLGGMRHACLVEVVNSFDLNILCFMNAILKRSHEAFDWFEESFVHHRESYITSCNRMVSTVDALAGRFRNDLKGHNLTLQDLSYISEIRDNIELRIHAIEDKLKPLLEGVILHPETRHVIFSGVVKEYKVLLARLSETKDYEGRPPGCLFPIIYRNVFERARVEDEEPATEILGDWAITSHKEYREAGLFGAVSDEEFQNLTKIKNLYVLALENMNALGIGTIADLKRRCLFNKTLLMEHLYAPAARQRLTELTRNALAS